MQREGFISASCLIVVWLLLPLAQGSPPAAFSQPLLPDFGSWPRQITFGIDVNSDRIPDGFLIWRRPSLPFGGPIIKVWYGLPKSGIEPEPFLAIKQNPINESGWLHGFQMEYFFRSENDWRFLEKKDTIVERAVGSKVPYFQPDSEFGKRWVDWFVSIGAKERAQEAIPSFVRRVGTTVSHNPYAWPLNDPYWTRRP